MRPRVMMAKRKNFIQGRSCSKVDLEKK